MTISSFAVVTWYLCGMGFIPSLVSAAEGRIVFTGAIVESTCSIANVEITAAAFAPRIDTHRLICAARSHAADAAPRYSLTDIPLSSSESDQLLKYFDAYVKALRPGAADPTLFTQTYE
ncbi:MAG TPA: hypothetical protein VGV14_10690 [Rhodanobacter sp.]|nr:hypothetical protein [Rhodanobacter sp.]